jgi:membrane-bound serine protease (ClpP class)
MRLPLLLLLFCCQFLSSAGAAQAEDVDSYRNKVVVIEVGEKDLMNQQAFKFFRRTLRRVDDEQARAVIFELNTPGGLAQLTAELMMNEMSQLEVPSYAFVNKKAISAGALIAVATDEIYMAPVASIGSAAIVSGTGQKIEDTMRAKLDSAYGAFVRSVVKKKGHRVDVVEAMMFPDKEFTFGDITVGKGELLNLESSEAVADFEGEPLLAKGIVSSVDELLKAEDLSGSEVVSAQMTGLERIAYWIGAISPLLIVVGLAGGYLEMKTPGFGIGGGIALAAFALFFFGNYVAGNLAGYEVAALFVLGVLLVIIDIFILPGTFVLGFTGVTIMLGTLLFAMVGRYEWEDVTSDSVSVGWWEVLAGPALGLAGALLGAIILIGLMMRYLPNLPFLNRYLLPSTIGGGSSSAALVGVEKEKDSRVGWTGVAVTDLRPSGRGEFQDQQLDVTAESSYVSVGSKLRIVSESSMRIVVKKIE